MRTQTQVTTLQMHVRTTSDEYKLEGVTIG